MIKEAIAAAPSIEEAQENAVRELNAPEGADVQFDVLDFPAKKVFGLFGGSQAKVRAYYEAPDAPKPKPKPPAKPPQKDKPAPKAKQERPAPKPAANPQEAAPAAASNPAESAAESIELPAAVKYLGRVFAALGVDDAKFRFVQEEGDSLRIFAESEQSTGSVIGRKGETLDAVQTLARLFINQAVKRYAHITLEVGDYRAKRAEHLQHLAQKTAARVLKTGRNTALDPMNPFERRIIHTVIAEIEGVESHSVGYDDGRKVLITPAGKFEERPERPRGSFGDKPRRDFGSREGFRRDSGSSGHGHSGFDRRGGRDNDRKPPYQPQTPARAPRTDAGGSALYGKVEVPARKPEE
ncbi:MAG: Jag N-terminal domain-containing protein [Oscillospiraceae bacterium]|jgi:spoIIIJ-associated protein|nr:Jag N-terminal domain-containing protein [Oscillospiraceae bacterium]